MPILTSMMSKEEQKAAWALKRTWTKDERDAHARFLRALRNGTLRIRAVDDDRIYFDHFPKL